jgi:hypothetical protein
MGELDVLVINVLSQDTMKWGVKIIDIVFQDYVSGGDVQGCPSDLNVILLNFLVYFINLNLGSSFILFNLFNGFKFVKIRNVNPKNY